MILAKIISRVFEPMVVLTIIVLLGGLRSGLTGNSLICYCLLLVSLILLVFLYRLKLKKGGVNWDVSERKKRIKPLLLLILVLVAVFWLMGKFNNLFLTGEFFPILIWTVGFFLITLVYKISGHVSVLTLVCTLVIRWYGPGFWPVYLTIPLLAWSRVKLKAHSVGQVIAGFLYSYLFQIL